MWVNGSCEQNRNILTSSTSIRFFFLGKHDPCSLLLINHCPRDRTFFRCCCRSAFTSSDSPNCCNRFFILNRFPFRLLLCSFLLLPVSLGFCRGNTLVSVPYQNRSGSTTFEIGRFRSCPVESCNVLAAPWCACLMSNHRFWVWLAGVRVQIRSGKTNEGERNRLSCLNFLLE